MPDAQDPKILKSQSVPDLKALGDQCMHEALIKCRNAYPEALANVGTLTMFLDRIGAKVPRTKHPTNKTSVIDPLFLGTVLGVFFVLMEQHANNQQITPH